MPSPDVPADILRDLDAINFTEILLIVIISWLLIGAVQNAIPWIANRLPSRFRFYLLPLVPIVRLLILGVVILWIFFLVIQPSAQNVFAIAGALAFALGFAFKDYVSSIIAGIVAIYERPYRSGDWVTIDGDYGEVKSVGLRALQITTPNDDTVTIPHAKLWDSNIANANNGQRDHMCIANFYLHPEHNADHVRQLLWDIALTSPYIQLERPILVIVMEKPWATHYMLKVYPIEGRSQFQFISDLTVRGKAALAQIGARPATIPPTWLDNNDGGQIIQTF